MIWVVDLGLAQLHRPVEELGDQQILPFRGELDEPERGWAGQPGQVQLVQRVVLLLDQPPHRVERLLVLQPPVQQLPAQLVPAVRTQVALGVQLAEQDRPRVALDLDPQRGRAGRPGQPERLDLLHDQAQLILQGALDRLPASPADIQMGAAAPPVGDRVDLVGGEPAEQQQREGDPDAHPDQHVGRGIHAQRHPGQGDQDDQPGHHPLAEITPATLRHQRVQHRHQARGQKGDLHRRHRPATPARLELDPERAWPPTDHGQDKGEQASELHDDKPDDQVPPAPQDQQHQQQPVEQRVQHPPGTDTGQAAQGRHQPRPDQAGQPTHHRVIHHGDRHGRAPQSAGEDRQGQPDQDHGRHQPADPAGLQPIRQRRGRPGRPPPPRRPHSLRVHGQGAGRPRAVCGHVHGPSQPEIPGSRHDDLVGWVPGCQGSEQATPSASCSQPQSWLTEQQPHLSVEAVASLW